MTKVLVIGADSRIARWADQMLAADGNIDLTMFVRNPEKLPASLKQNRVITGDATKLGDLLPAIKGQDVVYASLAGDVINEAKTIVEAMDLMNVKRLIWTSSLGIYDEVLREFGRLNTQALPGYLQVYRKAADLITSSDLEYTIIRPAWLTDVDEIDYEVTHHNAPFKGTEVSRRSVAAYAVDLINHPRQDVRDSVGVDKPGSDGARPRAAVMEANGFDPNM